MDNKTFLLSAAVGTTAAVAATLALSFLNRRTTKKGEFARAIPSSNVAAA
jgi:hypothetical protein